MQTRFFTNYDVLSVRNLWQEKTRMNPTRYVDVSESRLDAEFFGNLLFDPRGLFLVSTDEGRDVGFICASFGPNDKKNECDFKRGVLYSPFLASGLDAKEKTSAENALIFAAEKYLIEKGAKTINVGGFPGVSPLMTGLYGRCSAPGLYEDDPDVDVFRRFGYCGDVEYCEYCLEVGTYSPLCENKFFNARDKYQNFSNLLWTSRKNWYEENVYSNYSSREWLLNEPTSPNRLSNAKPYVLAGALTHSFGEIPDQDVSSVPSVSSVSEARKSVQASRSQTIILSFLAVRRSYTRLGVGSVLLAEIVEELAKHRGLVELRTVVSRQDSAFCHFLERHSFLCVNRFWVLQKSLDSGANAVRAW